MAEKPPFHTVIVEFIHNKVKELKQQRPKMHYQARAQEVAAYIKEIGAAMDILSRGHVPKEYLNAVAQVLETLRDKKFDDLPSVRHYVAQREKLIAELRGEEV